MKLQNERQVAHKSLERRMSRMKVTKAANKVTALTILPFYTSAMLPMLSESSLDATFWMKPDEHALAPQQVKLYAALN